MSYDYQIKTRIPALPKALFLAIAAQTFIAGYSHAGPAGGKVVGGDGQIEHSGATTRIDQDTHRLSLEWDSFNVAADERVEFIQPSSSATALNRILDHNGSEIHGQINANGHVILMNPHGVLFGDGATVDVGGLVASGLNINSDDFMNGDLAFSALEDTAGTVVNRGVINAATGGNVALLGKNVANHGLITANLGHIALASGSEAVVTFDDQGLIGVRIDRETLAEEVGGDYAVENSGTLEASGGKILLNASVSADLFSEAVNHGDMSGSVGAVVHDDGSFTLGSGNGVVNTGTADVSTGSESAHDAGYVVMTGSTVDNDGAIAANAEGDNRAGQIYTEATDTVSLGETSNMEARNSAATNGKVSVEGDSILADSGALVHTSGNAVLTADSQLDAPGIVSNHLFIQSTGEVSQTGAVEVMGNAHLLLANGADVLLDNMDNDINTLSLDARYNTNVQIAESNDILLGDLNLVGSSAEIETHGEQATLSQAANSHTQMYGSDLRLAADSIVLGEFDSATEVNHSTLSVSAHTHINTNNSIELIDDFALMPTNASLSIGDFNDGMNVEGTNAVDLQAAYDENTDLLTIAHASGADARLSGLFTTDQTGPIHLSGTLTWDSLNAVLDHPENDVAVLEGSGGYPTGNLVYVDSNDITLGTLNPTYEYRALNPSVAVTSVGEGATIRQAPDTLLGGGTASLAADNIELGANGSSNIDLATGLNLSFSNNLLIDGAYEIGGLSISGDQNANTVLFGEDAVAEFAGILDGFYIDLGEGDDEVTITNAIDLRGRGLESTANFDVDMGAGNDALTFLEDLVISGVEANVAIDMGDGNDQLATFGEFLVSASPTEATVDIDLGAGNDNALLLDGLNVESCRADTRFRLGTGNDQLTFNGDMDTPITLGAGRDVVVVPQSSIDYNIVDFVEQEDWLVVATP